CRTRALYTALPVYHLLGTGKRGGVGHLMLQGAATDVGRITDRLRAIGGVHNQRNLIVFNHIDNVRTAFGNFIDPLHRHAGFTQHTTGTFGRDQTETTFDQAFGHIHHTRLVGITHVQEGHAAFRQLGTRTQLSFIESFAESGAGTHHFTGGFHFRAEDRIHTLELVEREYGFFH